MGKDIDTLEDCVITTAPIDYTLPEIMMSRGPKYLHMAFGFENDVALFNKERGSLLTNLWNDTLAFVYLEETFWMEHPICKLTGANWYDSNKARVANDFVQWITGECSECIGGTYIGDLVEYGLRPVLPPNVSTSTVLSSSIISEENGCNPNVLPVAGSEFSKPNTHTLFCMMEKFGDLKRDLRLEILLDVSSNMQSIVEDAVTRWFQVSEALPLLARNLADSTKITTTCFNQNTLEGPGCSSALYPNGTLLNTREALIDNFDSTAPKVGRDEVHLFESLLETYEKVKDSQAAEPSHRYVILVLSEDDNAEDGRDRSLELLNAVGLSYDPNQVRIYPILYHGENDDLTFNTLQALASSTNGQFSTATAENLIDVLTEFTYYW